MAAKSRGQRSQEDAGELGGRFQDICASKDSELVGSDSNRGNAEKIQAYGNGD